MLLKHVWGILSEPRTTWARIRDEGWTIPDLYLRVVVPLALISPIAGFIGTTQFGWQIGAGAPIKLTVSSAAQISIVYFGAILVTLFVIGALIYWMSDTYGSSQPLSQCVAIAAYAAVPLFLVGIFQIYPVLWINFLIGLPALAYAVYMLYLGVPIVMNISAERGFLFSSAVLAVGLVALVGLLASTVVLWSYGLGPSFTN
ncbi:MAG: Yip1 family protein [Gammaproteobacteria bacterium]|nr:Yip1 family protein [Gammaproteobacteria bacterium]